ncbi:hypothetical protein [Vibrio sp. SCSIO 43137]|uniref:hypothetical protein n=1 Tax=Vibrio sp. SCSIO 43137 TaxID=3021011 RepID=UPI0023083548|nr:hypothetical protein [Vibrio sp. SCSIO 43137]WCE31753.1 hypothetical protein PK654_21750 [Vibrio sp. SCSIO 43137]
MKLTAILLPVLLAGCADNSNNADYRLYQVPGRGMVLPGIEPEEREFAAKLCGTQIIKGISDAIENDNKFNHYLKQVAKAEKHNRQVYQKCRQVKKH